MAEKEVRGIAGEKALTAMLALMVAEREERLSGDSTGRKTEVILASAGLAPAEIAALVGKKYDTVQKTILRANADSGGGANG
jgi:DNA-directed RNA polymerase specialized sigma24 family protein